MLLCNSQRWAGVPFLVKAGKGLDERMAEVRVHFKPKAYNSNLYGDLPGNEVRVNCMSLPEEKDKPLWSFCPAACCPTVSYVALCCAAPWSFVA